VEVYETFGSAYRLFLSGILPWYCSTQKMEAVRFSETWEDFYLAKQHQTQEDSNLLHIELLSIHTIIYFLLQ
jgi:hypothetical protein